MSELSDNHLTFVVGFSMFPTLHPGDEVFALKSGSFTVGDVICYHLGSKSILHRITKVEKNKIYTKGDNNLNIDTNPITQKDIIGKLVKIRRDNKTYKIRNGFSGYLTRKKCLIIKKVKITIYALLKPACNLKPILWFLNKIGQVIINNHLSIIKQTNNCLMIYCGNKCCGYYDSNNKEWVLKNRFKLFFSNKQLQNLIEPIDMKKI